MRVIVLSHDEGRQGCKGKKDNIIRGELSGVGEILNKMENNEGLEEAQITFCTYKTTGRIILSS